MPVTQGLTVWFTGLSGAGKSTLAEALGRTFRDRSHRVEVLDGDEIRATLSTGLGFSRADRDTNVRRIGHVARLLSRNGVVAIVAAISPYKNARDEVRALHEAPFVEVFVECPIDELVRRDGKGLYAKAIGGTLPHFTGISDPYEAPDRADVTVHTGREAPEASLATIVDWLEQHALIARP